VGGSGAGCPAAGAWPCAGAVCAGVGAAGGVWAGAGAPCSGCAASGSACWARRGEDQPPRMVPTRKTALARFPIFRRF